MAWQSTKESRRAANSKPNAMMRRRLYRESHRGMELQKKHDLKYLYGATLEEVAALRSKQGGLCAICRCRKNLQIDHDNSSKRIRGLLCGECNRALGLFYDLPASLVRALTYILRRN
jgi:hypothetical protein